MGGCASKPKESDNNIPVEAPAAPGEKPQLETATQVYIENISQVN